MGKMNSLVKYAALIFSVLLFKQVSALKTTNVTLGTDNLEKDFKINFYVWSSSLTILLFTFFVILFLKWKNSKKESSTKNYDDVNYDQIPFTTVDI